MPQPVSAISTCRWRPGLSWNALAAQAWASRSTAPRRKDKDPPPGMAWLALIPKFMNRLASWELSPRTQVEPASSVRLMWICLSRVRSRRATVSRSTRPSSRGPKDCWPFREAASSLVVRSPARVAAVRIISRYRSRSPGRVRSPLALRTSAMPVIPMSMLLKSWATPPASWPMASSFWLCSSCS